MVFIFIFIKVQIPDEMNIYYLAHCAKQSRVFFVVVVAVSCCFKVTNTMNPCHRVQTYYKRLGLVWSVRSSGTV